MSGRARAGWRAGSGRQLRALRVGVIAQLLCLFGVWPPAFASAIETEADAGGDDAAMVTANHAVEGVGLSASLPFYSHTVSSQGGWRDDPRFLGDRAGVRASLVVPVGAAFGARLAVGGAWTKIRVPSGMAFSTAALTNGSLDVGISAFWRNPQRGELGLDYEAGFVFADSTSNDRGNYLGASGAFFLGDFDLAGSLGWVRGKAEFQVLSVSFASVSNGVDLGVRTTWYAVDALALSVDGVYAHATTDLSTIAKVDSGGVRASFDWLPPLGRRRMLVLGAGFGYTRSHRDATVTTAASSTNTYAISARLQLVWPGVVSLKQLARQY